MEMESPEDAENNIGNHPQASIRHSKQIINNKKQKKLYEIQKQYKKSANLCPYRAHIRAPILQQTFSQTFARCLGSDRWVSRCLDGDHQYSLRDHQCGCSGGNRYVKEGFKNLIEKDIN